MRKIVLYIILIVPFILYSQIKVNGLITEPNTNPYLKSTIKKPVKGVQIISLDAIASVTSNDNGYFLLSFTKKPDKGQVNAKFIKQGYELFNSDFINNWFLSEDMKFVYPIKMCPVGTIAKLTQESKDNQLQTLYNKFQIQKVKLDEAKLDNQKYNEQLQVLQAKLEANEKLIVQCAEQFAHIDFDDVSESYRKAYLLYNQGKLDSCIIILNNANLLRRSELRIHEDKIIIQIQGELNKRKEDNELGKAQDLQALFFLARSYCLNFDYKNASLVYDRTLEIDSTQSTLLLEVANFYLRNNEYFKAFRVFKKILSSKNLLPKEEFISNMQIGIIAQNKSIYITDVYSSDAYFWRALRIAKEEFKKDHEGWLDELLSVMLELNKNSFGHRFNYEKTLEEALAFRKKYSKINPRTYHTDIVKIETEYIHSLIYKFDQNLLSDKIPRDTALLLLAEKKCLNVLDLYDSISKNDNLKHITEKIEIFTQLIYIYSVIDESKLPETQIKINELNNILINENSSIDLSEKALALISVGADCIYQKQDSLAEKFYYKALTIYRTLASKAPNIHLTNVIKTLNILAEFHYNNKEYDEAEKEYREIIDLEKANYGIVNIYSYGSESKNYLQIANIYKKQNQKIRAINKYLTIIDSENYYSRLHLNDYFLSLSDLCDVLEELSKSICPEIFTEKIELNIIKSISESIYISNNIKSNKSDFPFHNASGCKIFSSRILDSLNVYCNYERISAIKNNQHDKISYFSGLQDSIIVLKLKSFQDGYNFTTNEWIKKIIQNDTDLVYKIHQLDIISHYESNIFRNKPTVKLMNETIEVYTMLVSCFLQNKQNELANNTAKNLINILFDNNEFQIRNVYSKLAIVYQQNNQKDDAIINQKIYIEILEQYLFSNKKDIEIANELAESYSYLGDIYAFFNMSEEGLKNYKLSMEILKSTISNKSNFENFKRREKISDLNMAIGNIYLKLKRDQDGIDSYIVAIDILNGLSLLNIVGYYGDSYFKIKLANTYGHIAYKLNEIGLIDASINYYNNAIKVYNQLSIIGINDLTGAWSRTEQYGRTISVATKEKSVYTKQGEYYYNLGLIYENINDSIAALNFNCSGKIYKDMNEITKDNLNEFNKMDEHNITELNIIGWKFINKSDTLIKISSKDSAKLYLKRAIKISDYKNYLKPDKQNIWVKYVLLCRLSYYSDNIIDKLTYIKEAINNLENYSINVSDTLNLYQSYANLSWCYIFINQFAKSESYARRAIEIAQKHNFELSKYNWIYTNLAHSFLFQSKYDEAKKIYMDWKDKPNSQDNSKTFKDIFLNDFIELEKAGITHPDIAKIRELLK
jgi:tetratricopeptide (TPR) repeat protein